MTIFLSISRQTKKGMSKKVLEKVVNKILKQCGIDWDVGIDINFVTNQEIASLNKKYRKRGKSTDVLSFSYKKDNNFVTPKKFPYLGEIFIAPGVVQKNAQKRQVSFRKECVRVLLHGILHLLGYEHESGGAEARRMKKLEEEILCDF